MSNQTSSESGRSVPVPQWSSSATSPSTTWSCPTARTPDGDASAATRVHAAAAALTCGGARRRRRPPRRGLPGRRRSAGCAGAGSTRPASVDVAGPDGAQLGDLRGRRPPALGLPHAAPGARAEVAPRPDDIPAAWLPARRRRSCTSPRCRWRRRGRRGRRSASRRPSAVDHAGHARGLGGRAADRVLALARLVDVFVPSLGGAGRADRRPTTRRRAARRWRAPGVAVRGGQGGRRRRLRAGGPPRATCPPPGRGRRPDRRGRQLLRRVRGRAGARASTPVEAAGARRVDRGAPRSARPASCGCSSAAGLARDLLARPRRWRPAGAAACVDGRAPGTGGPAQPPGRRGDYDIDVMRREIAMIPDVIAAVLADAGGHVPRAGRAGWPGAASSTCA